MMPIGLTRISEPDLESVRCCFIHEVKLTPQLKFITDIDFYSRSEIFFAISSK